jgi:hypothetical protein
MLGLAVKQINNYISIFRDQLKSYLENKKKHGNKLSYLVFNLKGDDIRILSNLLKRAKIISYLIHTYYQVPILSIDINKKKYNYYLAISGFLPEGNETKSRHIGLFAWTPEHMKYRLKTLCFFDFGPFPIENPQFMVDGVVQSMSYFLQKKNYTNVFENFIYKKKKIQSNEGNTTSENISTASLSSRSSSRKSSSSRSSLKSSKSSEGSTNRASSKTSKIKLSNEKINKKNPKNSKEIKSKLLNLEATRTKFYANPNITESNKEFFEKKYKQKYLKLSTEYEKLKNNFYKSIGKERWLNIKNNVE